MQSDKRIRWEQLNIQAHTNINFHFLSAFKLDYKNYLAFINHCPHAHSRGNPSYYGVLPPEEPVYNWRTVIVSTHTRRLFLSNRQLSYLLQPSTWHLARAT